MYNVYFSHHLLYEHKRCAEKRAVVDSIDLSNLTKTIKDQYVPV